VSKPIRQRKLGNVVQRWPRRGNLLINLFGQAGSFAEDAGKAPLP
jgi:hypothetical protein